MCLTTNISYFRRNIKNTQIMKKIFTCFMLAAIPMLLHAQSGELDSSFNGNGIVIGSYTSENNSADAMAIQADGKIVVAGATGVAANINLGVSRFNNDGSLDTTFGTDGKVILSSGWIKTYILDMKIQNDGKIVMAGYRWNNETGDFIMFRLNEDGSVDPSFGNDGLAIFDTGEAEVSESFAILEDGKFILSGYINEDFSMVKVNSDGSIDTTFGTNGWVLTDFAQSLAFAYDININAEGKIMLAGASLDTTNMWNFALARYNPNGTLDSSFGNQGKLELSPGIDNDFAIRVLQLENGKILVGGHSWFATAPVRYELSIVQLNNDGSLDTSYGTNGVLKARWQEDGENYISDMALQNDGKLVITGRAIGSNTFDFGILRVTEDGQLDETFADNGKTITPIDLNDSKSVSLAIQTDGKIVVSGDTARPGENVDFFIARYLNDEEMSVQDFSNNKIALYPNPASSSIQINWTESNKEFALEIYNMLGQKVVTSKIKNNEVINISSLANGNYFIKLSNEVKTETLRFIKK